MWRRSVVFETLVFRRPSKRSVVCAILAASCLSDVFSSAAAQGAYFSQTHWNWGYYRSYEAARWGVSRKHHRPHRHGRVLAAVLSQTKVSSPVLIVVSIARQKLSVFANDTEIGTSPVSTGVPGHPTPLGGLQRYSEAALSRVKSLQRRSDALHAAHYLVRYSPACWSAAGSPGVARMHSASARLCSRAVSIDEGRGACRRDARRSVPARDCAPGAVSTETAGAERAGYSDRSGRVRRDDGGYN